MFKSLRVQIYALAFIPFLIVAILGLILQVNSLNGFGDDVTKLTEETVLTIEKNRLKTCPGLHCGWIFLDETKNARRKWCSMEACGNREKSKRNYERRRAASVSG